MRKQRPWRTDSLAGRELERPKDVSLAEKGNQPQVGEDFDDDEDRDEDLDNGKDSDDQAPTKVGSLIGMRKDPLTVEEYQPQEVDHQAPWRWDNLSRLGLAVLRHEEGSPAKVKGPISERKKPGHVLDRWK